jgi:hypothetical protein
MTYKMKVQITDPETPKEMFSEMVFNLDCYFIYDEEQYGNGHYVNITNGKEFQNYIDLRYDKTFNRNKKAEWLEQWARNYWSGKNGAWIIKSLEITKQ